MQADKLVALNRSELRPNSRYYVKQDAKFVPVIYLGTCGTFDGIPVLEWRELKTGQVYQSYSQLFFTRLPAPMYRVEYQESWGEWFPLSRPTNKASATRQLNQHNGQFKALRIVSFEVR